MYDGTTLKYMAKRSECGQCPLKPQCTTFRDRRISRDFNQQARDYTRTVMDTDAYAASRGRRKKIETLFGEVKHNLAFTRLRLRGLAGAEDEFLLSATVQNLKRLVKLAPIPPPVPITASNDALQPEENSLIVRNRLGIAPRRIRNVRRYYEAVTENQRQNRSSSTPWATGRPPVRP